MNETETEFKQKISVELRKFLPPIIDMFFNVDQAIDDNVEVLIKWLRNNKQLMTRLLNNK